MRDAIEGNVLTGIRVTPGEEYDEEKHEEKLSRQRKVCGNY